MPQSFLLEIATFTLAGAFAAETAGAHRVELCDNAAAGGTTPYFGMLQEAIKNIRIPVFPIIRPRGGNFVYDQSEINAMKHDIRLCKDLGFKGIVTGALTRNGNVDKETAAGLAELAFPIEVTFHRAFDRTIDPAEALEVIIDCGYKRILTSGQHPSVNEGATLLNELIRNAGDRIIIMPGSGLNSSNITAIANQTGAREFHTAARKEIFDPAIFSPPAMNETLSYTSVDTAEIKKILDALSLL